MERTEPMFFTEEEAAPGTQISFPGGKKAKSSNNLYSSTSDPLMERLWSLRFNSKIVDTRSAYLFVASLMLGLLSHIIEIY